jgi:hypothetical protein
MSDYIVVNRSNSNVVHVDFLTKDGYVVTVDLYGFGAGFFSDEKIIHLAQEELKRKLDSEIFALVQVRLKTDPVQRRLFS